MERSRRSRARPSRHRRPGTAVSEKGRTRSEGILDAATKLLIDEGYAQLSIRKIAARAGVRPGNLQYYYPTKQDVVRALLERYLARSLQATRARVASSHGTPRARLRASLDGILADQASADACRFFWEVWALAARDRDVARATRRFYDRYRQGVADALAAVSPRMGRARIERRAALAVALLEGLTVLRLGAPRRRKLDPRLLRELRALVLYLTAETRG